MSTKLALVGMAIVPPVAGLAVVYGRYVRGISRKLQDSLAESTKVLFKYVIGDKLVWGFRLQKNGYLT